MSLNVMWKKKNLLITVATFVLNPAFGGSDVPSVGEMFSDRAWWVYHLGYVYDSHRMPIAADNLHKSGTEYSWSLSDLDRYHIEGTKELNGKVYAVLKFNRAEFDNYGGFGYYGVSMPEHPRETFEIGIREENGRVYVNREEYLSLLAEGSYWLWVAQAENLPYETTSDGELVLYDFNKQVGDKYPYENSVSEISVIATDNVITLDGKERRLLKLSNGMEIIEGIGCTNSRGVFLFYLNPAGIEQAQERLRSYGVKNQFVYKSYSDDDDDYWKTWTYSTEVSQQMFIDSSTADIFDLYGRRMTGLPKPGIYIRDGRKYVVK